MREVFGIGVNDYDENVSYTEDGKSKKIKSYSVWKDMLRRCYSENFQEKQPAYKGCEVSKEWLLYSNFKKWFDENYPHEYDSEIKFHLDKDLLLEGNKIYSKEACIFLPHRINTFLSNKISSNKSGYVGVSFRKDVGKYRANINNFETRKYKHLGYFDSPIDGYKAYTTARNYMAILAKQYMRDLNIYSEEIISNIK